MSETESFKLGDCIIAGEKETIKEMKRKAEAERGKLVEPETASPSLDEE